MRSVRQFRACASSPKQWNCFFRYNWSEKFLDYVRASAACIDRIVVSGFLRQPVAVLRHRRCMLVVFPRTCCLESCGVKAKPGKIRPDLKKPAFAATGAGNSCPFRKFHPAQIRVVRQNHQLRFLEPFGRPFGLPVVPLRNCVCLGGLPRPTVCSAPLTLFRALAIALLR